MKTQQYLNHQTSSTFLTLDHLDIKKLQSSLKFYLGFCHEKISGPGGWLPVKVIPAFMGGGGYYQDLCVETCFVDLTLTCEP